MATRDDQDMEIEAVEDGAEEAGTTLEVGLIFVTTIALVLGIVVGLLELKTYGAGMLS
jgi:hypothetical protein